jgi:hypothetical protein
LHNWLCQDDRVAVRVFVGLTSKCSWTADISALPPAFTELAIEDTPWVKSPFADFSALAASSLSLARSCRRFTETRENRLTFLCNGLYRLRCFWGTLADSAENDIHLDRNTISG